jgi:hypothetical protein
VVAQPKYLQTALGRGYRFVIPSHGESLPGAETSFLPKNWDELSLRAAGLEPDDRKDHPKERIDS